MDKASERLLLSTVAGWEDDSIGRHVLLQLLKNLAGSTRLMVLNAVAVRDGVRQCDLQRIVGITQATVSYHVKELLAVDLVYTVRQGDDTLVVLNPQAFYDLHERLVGQ